MELYQELLYNRVVKSVDDSIHYSLTIFGQESKDEIGGTEGFRICKIGENKYNLHWGNQFRPRVSNLWKTKEQLVECIKDICANQATETYCHTFLCNWVKYN